MFVSTCLCVFVVVDGCEHVCVMFVFSCFDCMCVCGRRQGWRTVLSAGTLQWCLHCLFSMLVLKDFVSFVRVIASFTQTAQQWRLNRGSPTPTFFLLICLPDLLLVIVSLEGNMASPNACWFSYIFCLLLLKIYFLFFKISLLISLLCALIHLFNNCCICLFVHSKVACQQI